MIEKKQLTFIVYLIHQLSEAWNQVPAKVYEILNSVNIIDDYIIPCYDMLHTLGREYLIEDISELVIERGGKL